jgi:hypothetical protein
VGKGGAAAGGAAAAGAATAGAPDAAAGAADAAGAPGVLECGAGCAGGKSVCDTKTQTCVECLLDTDCKDPSKPGCLLSTHKCEDCSKNSQCPADKPTCDVAKGQCQ